MTAHDLTEAVLAPQRADLAKKRADYSYWGDTATWIGWAIGDIETALARACTGPNQAVTPNLVGKMITEVEAAHRIYRRDADDPDGYGSATFHEVLRDLANALSAKT